MFYVVHQELPGPHDVAQVLDLLLEKMTIGWLERDTGFFQEQQDFPDVPDLVAHGPGENDHVAQVNQARLPLEAREDDVEGSLEKRRCVDDRPYHGYLLIEYTHE